MSKKVGIMTFHRADNLGAVLQAYALQHVLTNTFHVQAEIVDYRCPGIEEDRKKSSGLKALALRCYYAVKHGAFERFRNRYLCLSPAYTPNTIEQCGAMYDAFITGSDQVWNYKCSDGDDAYFLSFVAPGKKKYSYAASIGRYHFPEQKQPHVKALLQDFSRISVREASAQQELQKLGIENTTVCADPVVLLSKQQWMQIMPGRRYRGKYVFVYLIMESESVLRAAREYAREHGCKVICNKTSPEFILRGSPADFLSWIYHAECVFTNSFHGTSFALILGKPLAADTYYPDGKVNGRVKEMLERSEAQRCALECGTREIYLPDAQTHLEKMRKDSYRFLEELCKDCW